MGISNRAVTVFGAYGHTGRFVVAELHKRGWKTILSGRDAAKLNQVAAQCPESEARVASVDDDGSLDRAMADASAGHQSCRTFYRHLAIPIIEAALRAGIHYFDVAAEQAAVLAVFERFSRAAKEAGVVIAPAMAFYGGLGDLLATAAMGEWSVADEILIGVALDGWKPTPGTRLTGQRNPGQRFIVSHGRLERSDPPPPRTWKFPAPFGQQNVVGLSFAETITISRHLRTPQIHVYMNDAPIADIRNPDTPAPAAADETGRSSQTFLMEVIARKGAAERRAVAHGRDIYAVTAPIVVEGGTSGGQRVGQNFIRRRSPQVKCSTRRDFLEHRSLPAHLSFELH